VSAQPPGPGQPQVPDPDTIHCPRCAAPIGPEQDWCLECGAPARTRLAQTPNWRLPTVAIGAIVLIAGALLAFAFVKLTNDSNAAPAAATTVAPAIVDTVPATPVPTVPPAVPLTTVPAGPAVPSTVPGQTTPAPVTPATTPTTATTATTATTPSAAAGQRTVPASTTPTTTTP
jgi:hypothetical protein